MGTISSDVNDKGKDNKIGKLERTRKNKKYGDMRVGRYKKIRDGKKIKKQEKARN